MSIEIVSNKTNNYCRTCLSKNELILLYSNNEIVKILQVFMQLQVDINDGLPKHICLKCIEILKQAYSFYTQCKRIDENIRKGIIKLNELDEENCPVFDNTCLDENRTNLQNKDLNFNTDNNSNESEIFNPAKKIKLEKDCTELSQSQNDETSNTDKDIIKSENSNFDTNYADLEIKLEFNNDLEKMLSRYNLKLHVVDEPNDIISSNSKEIKPEEASIPDSNSDSAQKNQETTSNDNENEQNSREKQSFICRVCNKSFNKQQSLNRHLTTHLKYKCTLCSKIYTLKYALKNHYLNKHPGNNFPADCAGEIHGNISETTSNTGEKSINTGEVSINIGEVSINTCESSSHVSDSFLNTGEKSTIQTGETSTIQEELSTNVNANNDFQNLIEENEISNHPDEISVNISEKSIDTDENSSKTGGNLLQDDENSSRKSKTDNKNEFKCYICHRMFKAKHNLKKHILSHK